MKKRTKKTLACLLVLVLVFESLTGIPVLAAEEAGNGGKAAGDSFATAVAMQLDQEYDVTMEAEGNAYYKFTPQESDVYSFHVTGDWVNLYLHDEDFEYLDDNWGDDFDLSYDLEGGKTYYINISEEWGEAAACTVRVNKEMLSLSFQNEYEVNYGQEQTMQVTASSKRGPVFYQWYEWKASAAGNYEYEIIPGATQSSYTVTADTTESKEYQCVVTDNTETKTAKIDLEIVTITVAVSYPDDVEKGETATMLVQAESLLGKPLTYQWYHKEMIEDEDGEEHETYVLIPGAQDSSYQAAAEEEYNRYKCVISDGIKEISEYFTIRTIQYIMATGQTQQYANPGESVTFQVKARSSDSDVLTYEWSKQNNDDYGYTPIEGADRAEYTVRAAVETAAEYRCKISDGSSTVYMYFELQLISPAEKEIDRIVCGEGWPEAFAYEEVKNREDFTDFIYDKPLIVKYKDGTETTVDNGYCSWLDSDFLSGRGNTWDNSKVYVSYMGKTISYDAAVVKISEAGTALSPGEKITDQAGAGAGGRKYYFVSIPEDANYVIQISGLSGEGKEVVYSGMQEISFTGGFYEIPRSGVSQMVYFSVESAGTQPITYSVEADTVQNSSRPVSDSDVMQEVGYYRAEVETSGLYEVTHTGSGKEEEIAFLYNEELEEICGFYNQSTKYYLRAGEVYYIKNQRSGAVFRLAEEMTLPAGAKAGAEAQITWNLTDSGILSIEGTGDMPKYRYPWRDYDYGEDRTIQKVSVGKGITGISPAAFSQCTELRELELPESLISIGDSAVSRCKKLQSVTFPENLKEIGDHAFLECVGLKSIFFPSHVKKIGLSAFSGCSSLADVNAAGECRFDYIASAAFDGTAWKERQEDFVILGDTLLEYKGDAEEITIPESVYKIGVYGFAFSTAKKITMNGHINKIWEYGLYGCENLKEIKIPGSVTDIAYHAFSECTALESVVLSQGVQTVDYNAFSNCSSLNNITIEEGLQKIGDRAFLNDSSLKEVTIPKSTKVIGDYAFGYDGVYEWDTGWKVSKSTNPLSIRCYKDSKAHQYAVSNGLPFTLLGENGSTGSGGSGNPTVKTGDLRTVNGSIYKVISADAVAFAGLEKKNSRSVKIPEKVSVGGKQFKVTEIGDRAFQKTNIKSITMPSSIQKIGTKAFYACKNLKKITIPAGVRKIGSQSFGNCKNLKNITIKTTKLTAKQVGKKAFQGIQKKAVIKVPKSKFASYKKLLQKKGAGKKVTYKK